jgi:hypothetical protein
MEDWVNPLISAAAGLAGAFIGAGATLRAANREARTAQDREHRDALTSVYAAAFRLGHFYTLQAELMPKDAMLVGWLRNTLRVSAHANLLIARFFHLLDAYWVADGRLRAVASREELEALDELENAISNWQIGEPLPESWPIAFQRLRRLVQHQEAGGRASSRGA